MAEQYASFYGREPNIDINLFPNATSAGISQGNAQPSTFGAVLGGLQQGIQSGIATAQGVQAIRQNENTIAASAAANEINTDPEVIDAKKKIIIAQGNAAERGDYIGGLETEIVKANEDTFRLEKTAELEAKAAQAIQTRDDLINKREINAGLNSPGNAEMILTNPSFMGTMSRDTAFANQVIGRLEAQGADPTLIKQARAQFDAVELQKRRAEQLQQESQLRQKYAIENQNQAQEAIASLGSLPGFDETSKGKNFDYRKVNIYPAKGVSFKQTADGLQLETDASGNILRNPLPADEVPSYVMSYGTKIIEPYLSSEDGRHFQKQLNTYKTWGKTQNWPTYDDAPGPVPTGGSTPLRTDNIGLAASATPAPVAAPTPGATTPALVAAPTPGATNENIIAAARQRNEAAFKVAQSAGQGSSYEALVSQGAATVRRTMPAPDYLKTPQNTPVPLGTPAVTIPAPSTAELPPDNIEAGEERLSQVLGGAPVKLNVSTFSKPIYNEKTIQRVNSIPALDNQPALLKGLVVTESGGNPEIVSTDGGVGLFQFMKGTAADLGLSSEDRKDPNKATPAAVKYLSQQYENIERQINRVMNDQGINLKPDPRMVLAAYNGGLRYVLNGIKAGNLTWDDMKGYLLSVKNPEAGRINTEYPDKVITASLPFIKGGNASDDSLVRSYINYGIVEV